MNFVSSGKIKKINLLLVAAAFLLTAACIAVRMFMNETTPELFVGMVAPKDYIAAEETVNEIATNRLRKAAADSVREILAADTSVNEKIMSQLAHFFEQAFDLRRNYVRIFDPYEEGQTGEVRVNLSVYLTDSQRRVLLEMETDVFLTLNEQLLVIMDMVLEQGIADDAREKAYAHARDEIEKLGLSVELNNLAYAIISSFIEPNLYVDETATNRAREDRAAEVVPEVYKRGQMIVRKGALITEEAFAVLEELGLTQENRAENLISFLGALLLVLVLFIIYAMYTRRYFPSVFEEKKDALLLFTLFTIVILIAALLPDIPYMFVPILIFTFLISMLLGVRLAVFLNVCVSAAALLIFGGGMEFAVYFLVTGSAAALFGQYSPDRNKIFLIAALLSLVSVCVAAGYLLVYGPTDTRSVVTVTAYAAVSGIFTVIISVGSLPFWEAVFGILTPVKLMDLANPNNELLRYMIIEAPGTYQHSLIVANLAETAAYDIGANPLAARAGGYYHDIGKIKYPQYFAENQKGLNLHDDMEPRYSAEVILSHVNYGLELAGAKKFPKIIKDMISQHHGTNVLTYFYQKQKNLTPDIDVDENDFRYPGPMPETREAAVVMLADIAEAAVRSMAPTGKELTDVNVFLKKLIKEKLD